MTKTRPTRTRKKVKKAVAARGSAQLAETDRKDKGYVRPPLEDQTFIPEVY